MNIYGDIAAHFDAAIDRAHANGIAAQSNGIVTTDEPRRVYLQSCADQFLADRREPLAMPESAPVQAPTMTAHDIVRLAVNKYGLPHDEVIDQLMAMDFEAAREAAA